MDKVIVCSTRGLGAKYGASSVDRIGEAIQRLVRADAGRGLATAAIDIADDALMRELGGTAVTDPQDQEGAKAAVDAIYARIRPDYVVLLDGPDVVPHVSLDRIPGLYDADLAIDSDLPYASPAPFSRRADAYLSVTRVVGRIPVPRGFGRHDELLKLLDFAVDAKPATGGTAPSYFCLSAADWEGSTKASLSCVFGNHDDLLLSPESAHVAINPLLGRAIHFINCHGADADPCFRGALDGVYPVCMDSGLVRPLVAPGAVVVAECCYGAQLFGTGGKGLDQAPMAFAYALGGAAAFVGSTTLSYAPRSTNGQADLLAQYFLGAVLKNASTGRSLLEARQEFVRRQVMSNPLNLKTLAQFVLYGDPSQTPFPKAQAMKVDSEQPVDTDTLADASAGRKLRRVALEAAGNAAAGSATRLGRAVGRGPASLDRLRSLAASRGFRSEPRIYAVRGSQQHSRAAGALVDDRRLALVVERGPDHYGGPAGVAKPSYRVLSVQLVGDAVAAVHEAESR
ncbi:C25 family cysteine peptidase [Lichenihabitans sp. Uapishka_5]|uniref:C25 family cysteine peptidase n=1 Tax=Lichenihabitans sp. Uapishka_5 TaxID=3037302 RepID=UPI0029E7D99B|nr:C25 family cysteine peptidase [Lichenihabitans sp. Uapishka_5]MDX7953857.1 C25 family cysteine peptidase [Lichenihabitans sp. Uapishka_5]